MGARDAGTAVRIIGVRVIANPVIAVRGANLAGRRRGSRQDGPQRGPSSADTFKPPCVMGGGSSRRDTGTVMVIRPSTLGPGTPGPGTRVRAPRVGGHRTCRGRVSV